MGKSEIMENFQNPGKLKITHHFLEHIEKM